MPSCLQGLLPSKPFLFFACTCSAEFLLCYLPTVALQSDVIFLEHQYLYGLMLSIQCNLHGAFLMLDLSSFKHWLV